MDEQLMSWANARPEVTQQMHSTLHSQIKICCICKTHILILMLLCRYSKKIANELN